MTRVHLAASRRRSISTHQHTKHTEHHADGQSDIESHASSSEFSRPCLRRTHVPLFHHLSYQKIQLRTTRAVSTTTASTAGFWYHASPTSFGLSVSAYTNPLSSPSGRGFVSTEMRIVTVKHVVQAKIAVQKFCAISLG